MASAQQKWALSGVGDLGAAIEWRAVWSWLPLDAGALVLLLAFPDWAFPGWFADVHISWAIVLAAGAVAAVLRPAIVLSLRPWRPANAVLVVGAGEFADALYAEFRNSTLLGTPGAIRTSAMQVEDLLTLARGGGRPWASRLVAAFPGGWSTLDKGLQQQLKAAGCRLEDGTEWFERLKRKLPIEMIEHCLDVPETPAWALAAKRASDCLLAAAALLLLGPLMLLLAALIRLDTPGSAIFRQRRVGRGGRLFTLYKFRSMVVNADKGSAALPAAKDDPRCTRVGRRLRRLRLDELPQLINVLRGDMALVGPRPFVPEQESACERAIPGYTKRWSVPPGATGWAQVNRGYCSSLADNREKLAYDLFYIKHFSLWLDLKILFRTLSVMFLGRGGR